MSSQAGTVLLVASVFSVAYYGGRSSLGISEDFSHADVVNALNTCSEDQFVGGCTRCGTCSSFEYEAGGCSYFKDTFCTKCEPIKHCPQEHIHCTAGDDERCTGCSGGGDGQPEECGCDNGYYGDDCKPCKVCAPGEFEEVRCTQDTDTVCKLCDECEENFRITKTCTYYENTECTLCRPCKTMAEQLGADGLPVQGPNFFKQQLCETKEAMVYPFPRSVYTLGADTVCQVCTEPIDGAEFVQAACDMYNDTDIVDCPVCECQDLSDYPSAYDTLDLAWAKRLQYETRAEAKERTETCEYRSDPCISGDYNNLGVTTECTACTPQAAPGTQWEVFACFKDSDALWKDCGTCSPGEYVGDACTAKSDVSCPDCVTDIQGTYFAGCEEGAITCTDETDTVCGGCQDGFFGPACCYHKYHGACGTITTRERAANRGGFEGSTDEQFIQFCMELCDEFPTCMAFELRDDGSNLDESGPTPAYTGQRTSICYFKSAFTQQDCRKQDTDCDWETQTKFNSVDPSQDCYSNICRQNSANQRPKLCSLAMQGVGQCSCGNPGSECPLLNANGSNIMEDIPTYYPAAYPIDGKPDRPVPE